MVLLIHFAILKQIKFNVQDKAGRECSSGFYAMVFTCDFAVFLVNQYRAVARNTQVTLFL